MSSLRNVFVASACLFFAHLVLADAATGYQWLSEQQKANGAIEASDSALGYQASHEAVEATSGFDLLLLSGYLQNVSGTDTELLARAADVYQEPTLIQAALSEIVPRQNTDGGFGHEAGFSSTPYDTYWALVAVTTHTSDQTAIYLGLNYLIESQNADGGWSYPESFSSVYLTARVTELLARLRLQYPTVQDTLNRASGFLLSNISLDSSVVNKAVTLKALALANASIDVTAGLVDNLLASQGDDGSWEGSVYSTALALQALKIFELTSVAAGAESEIASVSGRVVLAGSSEPLSGVSVSLASNTEKATNTDTFGDYTLAKLPLGTYTVLFSKSGYYSVTQSVTLTSGHTLEVPDVALQPAADGAVLSGRIYDEVSGLGVAAAVIELVGNDSYTITTSEDGHYSLPGIKAGSYQLSISATGYHSLTGQYDAVAGQINRFNQGIVPEGVVLDDSPVDLTGRVIDGDTGLPVAATLSLNDGEGVEVSTEGQFTLAETARGDYKLTVTAEGYRTATLIFTLPAGATGKLGDISVYKQLLIESPTTLDFAVSVRDEITKEMLEGVAIELNGSTVTTDATGVARFDDLGSLSFALSMSKAGYLGQSLEVTVGGFGESAINVTMTPSTDAAATAVSLMGVVRDEQGSPVEGAKLVIGDVEVVTGADGIYAFADIEALKFNVVVSAEGYASQIQVFDVQAFGNYSTDFTLKAIEQSVHFNILSIGAPTDAVEPYSQATFTAEIQSAHTEALEVVIRGQIFDLEDEFVTEVSALLPGTAIPESRFNFDAGEKITLDFNWNTLQAMPATYRVQIDVVEVDSISRALPEGIVLARDSVLVDVSGKSLLEGGIQFEPPLVQAGTDDDVELKAVIRNVGNIAIEPGSYQLTLVDEDGSEIHSATIDVEALDMNSIMELDFGTWLPEVAGHHQVKIQRIDDENLKVGGVYYVGDVATGEFTLAQQIFPEGDQSTTANIALHGVDAASATVSDELFERVKGAVYKGGVYAGAQGIYWDKRNRCLGCHIQSQAAFGLASADYFVDVDQMNLTYLMNTLTSAAQDNGSVRNDHTSYTKTQTGFALWAFSEWDDKKTSFQSAYDAAKFMYQKRTVSGSNIYWRNDHNTGWFNSNEGMTWAVAKGMADVISASETDDIKDLKVWSLDRNAALSLSANTSPKIHKMSKSEDGQSIFVSKYYAVEKITPAENSAEVVYTTSAYTRDAVDLSSNLYIIDVWDLVVIDESGQISRHPQTFRVNDLQVLNGEIYGAAPYDNRIVKLNLQTKKFETVKTSPLFNFPESLTATDDGELLITNRNNFNILKLSGSNELTIYTDGMSYRPFRISNAGNGEYFISTLDHYRSLQILHSNGVIERLFDNNRTSGHDFQGIELINGQHYTNLHDLNALVPLKQVPINLTSVNNFKSALQGVANYYDQSNSWSTPNEITRLGFRLMALSEAKTVVTDSAQIAVIDANIAGLAAKIHSFQRADGGWGQYKGWGSDPVSTAIMGFALDYTNPSADDPAVRKAITYLLNTQSANGSWWGRYFSTRLGTTGLVMAYLPRALQRLGGIDIGVNLEVPDNIELSDISVTPSVVTPQLDGSTLYNWDMEGVTANGQSINFTMLFKDLLVDDIRPAANAANINFANSFNGEQMTVALDIPNVTAVTNIGLLLDTDKTVYGANETVQITDLVSNMGPQFSDGLLFVEIRQAGFNHTIESLNPDTQVNLAQDETLAVNHQWQTGIMPAGDYVAYAKVVDSKGHLQVEASKTFTIVASNGGVDNDFISYALSVSTDKYEYQAFDQVFLSTRVRNQALNTTNEAVLAKLVVNDPNGIQIFSSNYVATEMIANGLQDFADQMALSDAPSGIYQVNVTLWNADVTEQITSAATTFKVSDTQLARIQGNVTVSAPEVSPGEPLSCTDTVVNRSATTAVDVTLQRLVVRVDVEQTMDDQEALVNLAENANWVSGRDVNTSGLEEGRYACVLIAKQGDAVTTLGFAPFNVVIKVAMNTTYQYGSKGRWLILLDGAGTDTGSEISSVAEQDSYLRALMDAEGWSYTIVYNGEDFARELYTGQYVAYGLFAEKAGLTPKAEQILTEAVRQGDGLMLSGIMNRRDNHIEKAVGVGITGHEQAAGGLLIPAGTFSENSTAVTLKPSVMLDIDRCEADVVASYVDVTKAKGSKGKGNSSKPHSACTDDADTEAAVVKHSYGKGKSSFIAFDALDEANAEGGLDNHYAELIRYTMRSVHPEPVKKAVNTALPIWFSVENVGIAVEARLTLQLAENVKVSEAAGWSLIEIDGLRFLQSTTDLAEEAIWLQCIYLQLLDTQPATMPLSIEYLLEGEDEWQLFEQQQAEMQVEEALVDLEAAIASLQAAPSNKDVKFALNKLNSAAEFWQQGDYDDAINHMLLALDRTAAYSDLHNAISLALLQQLSLL